MTAVIEVASVINLSEASGRVAAGLFMRRGNWVLPIGQEGHLPRKASDAHPPARRDWGPPGGWEGVRGRPTLTYLPGGTVSLEYQIHPPTIDTLVTRMTAVTNISYPQMCLLWVGVEGETDT